MIKISDTEYFSNDRTIRFLNMDCNEFMAGCKENEFDLIHNDPPYGINADKKQSKLKGKRGHHKTSGSYKIYHDTDWDSEIPTNNHFEEMFRVSKNQIIWGGNYFDSLNISGVVVWDKGESIYDNDGEMAKVSFGGFRIFRMSRADAYINKCDMKIHPTQKPIELYNFILDKFTKPTDTILDCFGGSMSNAIACHMKRRKLTIIELDVDYFKSALNRFEIYERQVEDIKEFGYAKTKLNSVNPTLF
mgnify:CR=1 FL=1